MDRTKRELLIAQNAAEIMLVYNDLANKGKVLPIYDDEIDSHELLATIAEIAAEFEEKYPYPEDYFVDLDEFATRKLTEKYEANYMDGADVLFDVEDVKGALEFHCIEPTGNSIRKIATKEFVRELHERLAKQGIEMINDKVCEVFNC